MKNPRDTLGGMKLKIQLYISSFYVAIMPMLLCMSACILGYHQVHGRAFTCRKDSTGKGLPPSDVTFLAFCGTSMVHVHVCEWIACCFSLGGGGVVLKALHVCGFSFIQDKNQCTCTFFFLIFMHYRTIWMTLSPRMECCHRTLVKGVGPYHMLQSWTTTTPFTTATEVSSHHIA